MTLVARLLRRAQRTPYVHLDGYMNRWWIFRTRWLSARIHEILRSDDDRALHDHPKNWCSVILAGGYHEITADGRRCWYGAGSIRFRRAATLHRLEVPEGTVAVTLFVVGPRIREWGFQTPDGWVHHRDYERMIADSRVPAHWRVA